MFRRVHPPRGFGLRAGWLQACVALPSRFLSSARSMFKPGSTANCCGWLRKASRAAEVLKCVLPRRMRSWPAGSEPTARRSRERCRCCQKENYPPRETKLDDYRSGTSGAGGASIGGGQRPRATLFENVPSIFLPPLRGLPGLRGRRSAATRASRSGSFGACTNQIMSLWRNSQFACGVPHRPHPTGSIPCDL